MGVRSLQVTDRRQFLVQSGALVGLSVASALRAPGAFADTAPAGTQRLDALFDVFMAERFAKSPELLSSLGLDKDQYAWARSQLNDQSLERVTQSKQENASRLKRLRDFGRDGLAGGDLANYDTVEFQLETAARAAPIPYGDYVRPYVVSQLTGSYQAIPSFLDRQHKIENREDAEAYLVRLHAFAQVLDQESARVQHDADLKVVPPDFLIERTLEQMTQLRSATPADSVLSTSLAKRAADLKLGGDYAEKASRMVAQEVYPALDRQLKVIQDLRGRAVHEAGVRRLPQGEELYRVALRFATTTDMTPAQVHALGLEQARAIHAQMDTLLRSLGRTHGSVTERVQALMKDPQYLYPDTDAGRAQVLEYCNGLLAALQPHLPKYFNILPKVPVEIRRVPEYTQAGAPEGYYNIPALDGSRPGAFYINLRDTNELPRWTLPTLVYHESAPGHHFQLALVLEMPSLPLIRKAGGGFSANTEGWALYAEQLVDEMGLYDADPVGRLGMLQSAIFRAARCVVDTGIHTQGWTRERAIDYMVETTGDKRSSMTSEVERYCTWPGQACSYKVGQTQWLKLRADARRRLGPRFDIRAFHDASLTAAPMPMSVLGGVIDSWVRSQGG
jgi:uncharacterized protein (DUF885 family)